MSATVLAEGKRIRRQASKGYRYEQVQLLATINDSVATLATATALPKGLIAGSVLSADLELMLVTSVDRATNVVSVIRGYQDSIAATHSAPMLIDVSPRFTMLDVVDAMQNEMASWSPQLFYPASDTLTVATTAVTYELPAAWSDMVGVLEVLQSDVAGDITTWPRIPCKLIRGTATSFDGAPTSGMLLRFTEPIRSGSMFITVARPYTPGTLTATTDLETDLFLTPGLRDLLAMGTKRRLMLDEVAGRVARQAQDESRRAEETPIGSLVPLSQMNTQLYNLRLTQEIHRLARKYPLRIV